MEWSRAWNIYHLSDEPLYYAAPQRPEDILVETSDADDTPTTRYYRRARRQQIGYRYLMGEMPLIQSAALRGPFSGWDNPWRHRSQAVKWAGEAESAEVENSSDERLSKRRKFDRLEHTQAFDERGLGMQACKSAGTVTRQEVADSDDDEKNEKMLVASEHTSLPSSQTNFERFMSKHHGGASNVEMTIFTDANRRQRKSWIEKELPATTGWEENQFPSPTPEISLKHKHNSLAKSTHRKASSNGPGRRRRTRRSSFEPRSLDDETDDPLTSLEQNIVHEPRSSRRKRSRKRGLSTQIKAQDNELSHESTETKKARSRFRDVENPQDSCGSFKYKIGGNTRRKEQSDIELGRECQTDDSGRRQTLHFGFSSSAQQQITPRKLKSHAAGVRQPTSNGKEKETITSRKISSNGLAAPGVAKSNDQPADGSSPLKMCIGLEQDQEGICCDASEKSSESEIQISFQTPSQAMHWSSDLPSVATRPTFDSEQTPLSPTNPPDSAASKSSVLPPQFQSPWMPTSPIRLPPAPPDQNLDSPQHPLFADIIQPSPPRRRSTSSVRLSTSFDSIPATQVLLDAATANPWCSVPAKSSQGTSSTTDSLRKSTGTKKRVSFSPALTPTARDAAAAPSSRPRKSLLKSPPVRSRLDETALRACFRVTKHIAAPPADDVCSSSSPASSPCVDAMAEAFRRADGCGAKDASRNLLSAADALAPAAHQPAHAAAPDDSFGGYADEASLNAAMDEVSDFLEHWDVETALRQVATTTRAAPTGC